MNRPRFLYPKAARILRRGDFVRLQKVGERGVRTAHFVLVVAPTPRPSATARLGVVVTKKVGSAPVRNRIKRLCREAFRLGIPGEHPQDRPNAWFPEPVEFLVIARAGAERLSCNDVRNEWRSVRGILAKNVARALAQPPGEPR